MSKIGKPLLRVLWEGMDTSISRSSSSFLSVVSVLLALGLAALLGRHLIASAGVEPPRVHRAEGYVNRVRKMLDSPRQALTLESRKLVFHASRADEDEWLFHRHSQWLLRDIERFNDGAPGFFSLRREKGGLKVMLDEHAHDVPLPLPGGESRLKVEIAGNEVPALLGADMRLIFDPPQEGAENASRTLDSADWLSGEVEERDYQAAAFLLRHGGANVLLLSQPKEGRVVVEPLISREVLVQINGIIVNRADKPERQQALRARVAGHAGRGFPLVDGDRLLITLHGGVEVALRYGLTRGGLHFDSDSMKDSPLLAQAQRAVRDLQGRPDITVSGALPAFTQDARLQTYVDKALQAEVKRLNALLQNRLPDISQRPACIAVLDALSGEALALVSYPDQATLQRWDAAALRGEDIGMNQVRLEGLHRNQNFQRVPIGSTTKPMLAAAIWETVPALRRLRVAGGRTTTSMYGHVIDGPMNNPGDGPEWSPVQWLEKSSNPYTLAAYLAALAPPDSYTLDSRGILHPKGRKLDLSRWLNGVLVKPEYLMPATAPAVHGKLEECFDISMVEPEKRYDSRVIQPWLEKLGLTQAPLPAALLPLVPESTHLGVQEFTRLRYDIVSMVIGGGGNRWTNLKLAEAYARLGTGQKVEATLVKRAQPAAFAPLPVSAATLTLVREGMTAVVMGEGTARLLRPVLEPHRQRLSRQGLRLVVHAKTGTATRTEGRECAALALYLALHDAGDTRRAALACTIYLEDRAAGTNSTNAVQLGAKLTDSLISHLERQAQAKK